MNWTPLTDDVKLRQNEFYLITKDFRGYPVVQQAMWHNEAFIEYPTMHIIDRKDVAAVIEWPKPYHKEKG